MAFCACAVLTAAMKNWLPFPANGEVSVLRTGDGAWRRRLLHLVDHVIPNVPMRQWVLSLPIPLRVLFAAHPQLLSPVLQVISRAISTFLIKQAGFKRRDAQSGRSR
uniref:hypothetical protein n=1 Tax=Nitrosomonas sp. Nm33 TaxID=133724 RepID=UPI00210DDE4C|nr:hypothetical protein [Nitrosomonas sp. Nm33]